MLATNRAAGSLISPGARCWADSRSVSSVAPPNMRITANLLADPLIKAFCRRRRDPDFLNQCEQGCQHAGDTQGDLSEASSLFAPFRVSRVMLNCSQANRRFGRLEGGRRCMTDESHYIISGGDSGAERLGVLSRTMQAGTLGVLSRAGLGRGMEVLDLGCGSGDMTVEIARLVGPTGRVTGIDMDDRALEHAKSLSEACGVEVRWRHSLVENLDEDRSYDIVYSRFLMSHLPDPLNALRRMRRAVRPTGMIVVEDIDITAHVHWPRNRAFDRYIELYKATGRVRGANPTIGPRLAGMLVEIGLTDVDVSISMPIFRSGEGKSIARLTLVNIAGAAIEAGLTTGDEVDQLLAELELHEADPRSIQSTAQVFQVTGRRPRN